jgi:hypothetical protein
MLSHSRLWFCLTLASCVSPASAADFIHDIQPILASHCYDCHGAEKQKGKLRLDQRDSALRTGKDSILTPGHPEKSELYRRITLPAGDDEIMPNRGEPLTKAETELVSQWIKDGAVWPSNSATLKHWAYVSPSRPPLPAVENSSFRKNPIDRFIAARLEKERLRPSPREDASSLLRRVYLDLIGLPPAPEQVAAFLADKSPDAYEKVVDALLQSPQFGVRWARPWLDLARYADSSGYQRDNLWSLWPYRDWVIDAINRNIPFDQFTIEQIAGDLLPSATVAQKIATGFNRCTSINVEAGSDQEESRVNQIIDRVNTVGTVWLGSTIQCAQCHNHKYDPFTQKDYYQFFAFFNGTPKETDFASAHATATLEFTGPYLRLPDKAVEEKRAAIKTEIERLDSEDHILRKNLASQERGWETQTLAALPHLPRSQALEISDFQTESESFHKALADHSVLLRNNDNAAAPARDTYTITAHSSLAGITGFKLEALRDPSLPGGGPGRGSAKRANFILTDFKVCALEAGQTSAVPVKFVGARASFEPKNFEIRKALDDDPKSGWGIQPRFSEDHWAVFETDHPLGSTNGATFTFVLKQDYGGGRMIGRVRLSAVIGNAHEKDFPAGIAEILALPRVKRAQVQQDDLAEFYFDTLPEIQKLKSRKRKLAEELKNTKPPETLVMEEMSSPRPTSIFIRGNFQTKGDPVQPDVPAALPALDGPRNRLGLARWLVSTNNPLVARVTVNRWWAEIFGRGIVGTPGDFGVKGDSPTHPQLLDWLAREFMDSGWSRKHILRLIVTSATYRQSPALTPELRERDDQNNLYARGPRFRMDAEMIRDNALAISGLLSLNMGGPPVHPYQPADIWGSKVGGTQVTYEISPGEDRHRRGIYTVWKRTSPYPSFITFDAANRITCVVNRPHSNTPLQALTLLDDPVYVESAQWLAARVLRENAGASVENKIRRAFELCLARPPRETELRALLNLYQKQIEAASIDPEAKRLLPEAFRAGGVDPAEFSAWYSVASALLNLDETITKG